MKKRYLFLIVLAVLGIIFWQYQAAKIPTSIVSRVIDGDTFVIQNGTHIRILGINTPEVNQNGYQEAKNRLSGLILGKQVQMDCWKHDKYGRDLCWVVLDNVNVSEVMISEGFSQFVKPY